MPRKANGSKLPKYIVGGTLAFLLILASVLVLYYGGILTGGTDSSHMESVDYSNYGWYLAIPVLILVAMVPLSYYIVRKAQAKNKYAVGTVALATVILLFATVMYVGFYVRSYHDSANVSDIALQTNAGAGSATLDLGNATILSASIEEYHDKDTSIYDKFRVLSFDDEWRVVIRYNNTAYWNSTGQNFTAATARIKGFALPSPGNVAYRDITGWIAPNTQPGAINYGDVTVLVFEDIERDPRLVYFVGEVLDDDGVVMGTFYIHPNIEMAQINWYLDQQV